MSELQVHWNLAIAYEIIQSAHGAIQTHSGFGLLVVGCPLVFFESGLEVFADVLFDLSFEGKGQHTIDPRYYDNAPRGCAATLNKVFGFRSLLRPA